MNGVGRSSYERTGVGNILCSAGRNPDNIADVIHRVSVAYDIQSSNSLETIRTHTIGGIITLQTLDRYNILLKLRQDDLKWILDQFWIDLKMDPASIPDRP